MPSISILSHYCDCGLLSGPSRSAVMQMSAQSFHFADCFSNSQGGTFKYFAAWMSG